MSEEDELANDELMSDQEDSEENQLDLKKPSFREGQDIESEW